MEVVVYLAQTVNGYIAKTDDSTPWSKSEWNAYSSTIRSAKNLVVGRKTYNIMKKSGEFKKCGNPTVVVVSRSKLNRSKENVLFVTSPNAAIKTLTSKGFSKIIIGGGSQLNKYVLEKHIATNLYIDVEPQLLGFGIPFCAPAKFHKMLKLLKIRKLSKNTIQLQYRILN